MSQSEATANVEQPVSQSEASIAELVILRRGLSLFKVAAKLIATLVIFYFGVCLIGLIPVNNEFSESPDGVEIFVTSNAVHAEIIVPVTNATFDWRLIFPAEEFPSDVTNATHVAIGWGDRGFFLQTPTWNDVTLSTAANAAFLPSSTCVHATMVSAVSHSENSRPVRGSFLQSDRTSVLPHE